MDIPFLVVHGAWLWKVVLAAFVVGVLLWWRAARHASERRLAREDAAQRVGGATGCTEGAVVVRARIVAGHASTLSWSGGLASDRSEVLAIELEGARVEVRGPVRVVQGTRAASWWLRPPRDLPAALRARARPRTSSVLRVVGPGDEVVVAGSYASRAGDAAGYRDNAARASIGADDPDAVWITAVAPAAVAPAAAPWRWIAGAAVTAALGLGALFTAGQIAMGVARSHAALAAASGASGPRAGDALAFAAALPDSRAKALEEIEDRFDDLYELSEASLAAGIAFDELRGRCPVRRLRRHVRLDEALAAARRCGTKAQVADILATLGRFAEVELVDLDDQRTAVAVAIARGDWREAANAVERVGASAEAPCFIAVFRTWAGEPVAFPRFGPDAAARCEVLEALTLPLAQQASAWLAESWRHRGFLESAGGTIHDGGEDGLDSLGGGYTPPRLWLVPFTFAAQQNPSVEVRARLHGALAALAAYRGDVAQAQQELAAAIELGHRRGSALATALAVRTGAVLPPEAETAPDLDENLKLAVALRRSESIGDDIGSIGSLYEVTSAVQAAQAGDGAPLAELIRSRTLGRGGDSTPMLGLLPRVTRHRDELQAALRFFRTPWSNDLPFESLDDFVNYRDVARAVGDAEDAVRWQAIIDRYAAALADRQRVMALLLWKHRPF